MISEPPLLFHILISADYNQSGPHLRARRSPLGGCKSAEAQVGAAAALYGAQDAPRVS
jgi:hypothetical protein